MYKRALFICASILALITGPFVHAEGQGSVINEAQIGAIRTNCPIVQSELTRIHTSDALSRVHLGQEYETISTKFMAPMNSRVALMKLNGIELARITVDFNDKLAIFRSQYQQYEQTLLRPIQMKCSEQPAVFYSALMDARNAREKVNTAVKQLGDLTLQYNKQVKELRIQALSLEVKVEAGT